MNLIVKKLFQIPRYNLEIFKEYTIETTPESLQNFELRRTEIWVCERN